MSAILPGDHLWLNQRPGYLDAGHWGMLKVLDRDSRAILPLGGQVPATQQAEDKPSAESIPGSMKAKAK